MYITQYIGTEPVTTASCGSIRGYKLVISKLGKGLINNDIV